MNFFCEPQTINIDNVTATLRVVCTVIAESVGAGKRSEIGQPSDYAEMTTSFYSDLI